MDWRILCCVMADGDITNETENEKNDWSVSAAFFHVFTLRHQIKSLNHMCTYCDHFNKFHNSHVK